MKQSQRQSIEATKLAAERLTRARLAEVDSEGLPVFAPTYPNGYRFDVHPESNKLEQTDPLAKAREAKAAKAAEAKAAAQTNEENE